MTKFFIFLISSLALLIGCSHVEQSYKTLPIELVDDNTQKQEISSFFLEGISKARYKSRFTFFCDNQLPTEVELLITEVSTFDDGVLYKMQIDCNEEFEGRYYYEWDRFQLGYFYVKNDKIIMLRGEDIQDKIKSESDVTKLGSVVCQNEEIKDELDEGEKWWHESITAEGSTREYYSYNALSETGFYETLIWEDGLKFYKSGFGAEKDDIELVLMETD